MSLSTIVAKLGENNDFVAFNAHWGFAYFVVSNAAHHLPLWPVALTALVAAALKEFAFDAHYETNPPQTMRDNVQDFAGYAAGVLLAVLMT